jgi:putative membrane protein
MWWSDFWWSDAGPMMPWMLFGPIVMLIFVVLCVTMMVFMMRGHGRHRSLYALDILKERFARGEINQNEYEERRRALNG